MRRIRETLGEAEIPVHRCEEEDSVSPRKNMYRLSVTQWNPFAGCRFDCTYCEASFKAQLKRQRRNCEMCYRYVPHEHPQRLEARLPRTRDAEFIFTCANGDVTFCSTPYLQRIVDRIRRDPERTFLIQSKDPATFRRVRLPENLIVGTTIESNRDKPCRAVSKAPPPSKRFRDLLALQHPRKMVTVEPVMDFDLDVLLDWITRINPVMVWIGYDSKKANLPEPPLERVVELVKRLSALDIAVKQKTIREAR